MTRRAAGRPVRSCAADGSAALAVAARGSAQARAAMNEMAIVKQRAWHGHDDRPAGE